MIDGYYAVDYQVHSFRSHDGKDTIDNHCRQAVILGLDELGFSEHKDFHPDDPVVNYFDYGAFMKEIEDARAKYGDRLKIRAGVEIDYQHHFEHQIGHWLETHKFDYVIGSVHYVDGVMLMTPEYNQPRGYRKAYADYFHAVRLSVQSGLFDILGHFEYATKRGINAWGPYDPHLCDTEVDDILDELRENQMTLEVNSAGLRQGVKQTYPCRETVRMYLKRGGSHISFGSDAHCPEQLAHAYADTVRMLQDLGVEEIATYEAGERIMKPLKKVAVSHSKEHKRGWMFWQ